MWLTKLLFSARSVPGKQWIGKVRKEKKTGKYKTPVFPIQNFNVHLWKLTDVNISVSCNCLHWRS